MHSTSPSLLYRLKAGPNQSLAWNQFVELYSPMLIHWVQRTGLDREAAADIVQEILLQLMVRMPGFEYEPQSSFRAWLRTVTVNKCRDYFRRQQTRRHHESLKEIELPSSHESIFSDAEFAHAVSTRALELMKAEFEETTWRACWESTVNGRRAKEIGEELGISVNAVYLAKGRVLKRLRDELQGMI